MFDNTDKKEDMYNFYKKIIKETEGKLPVYRGCPNDGPCFCTGVCKEVVDYIEPKQVTFKREIL